MMSQETGRKVFLYIAVSVDGYIANSNGDIGFLSIAEKPGEDYGYGKFIENIDTVIMGRKTYDKVAGFGIPFPHADKQTFVITRNIIPSSGKITFYNGNLETLVSGLKQEEGKGIFVDGGSEIINELLKLNLIDEFIIFIIPVLLGEGIPLFKGDSHRKYLILKKIQSYDTGVTKLHYQKK
jgi:dihydrofolate reductase